MADGTGDAAREELVRALVFYAVEAAVMGLLLLALHNRVEIEAWWARLRSKDDQAADLDEIEVARFNRSVSEYEHASEAERWGM
jgi:hypothetical protein